VKINADYNASLVIKKRGIQDLVNGGVVVKQSRQVMRLKKHAKVGREQAKFTRGETNVRRSGDPTPGPRLPMIRETLVTTASAG
jgi:transposase